VTNLTIGVSNRGGLAYKSHHDMTVRPVFSLTIRSRAWILQAKGSMNEINSSVIDIIVFVYNGIEGLFRLD
jgi:hypothetical protein